MTWWAIVESASEPGQHVIPLDDLREHECSSGCWCRPEVDEEDPVWRHNSMDGREAFEDGRRLPS